jgi:hypothetical protein
MKSYSDWELGFSGLTLLFLLILALALAMSCATTKPNLWDLCKEKCAGVSAEAAAIVGPVDPADARLPACFCRPKPDAT